MLEKFTTTGTLFSKNAELVLKRIVELQKNVNKSDTLTGGKRQINKITISATDEQKRQINIITVSATDEQKDKLT